MTSVALVSLAALVYTYAGYPLVAALWARVAPRTILHRDDFEPTVSVCLAVHDGAEHLTRKLESLQALEYPAEKIEILVYSDGSTDATERIAHELAERDPRIRVFSSCTRLGKPAALNGLRRAATGDVLMMTDVRQTLHPRALRAMLRVLADPAVGCVSGCLVLAGDTGASAYWRYERLIRGFEARVGAMVGVSGSLYAIRRVDFGELPTDVLLDDMFVPLRVALARRSRGDAPRAEGRGRRRARARGLQLRLRGRRRAMDARARAVRAGCVEHDNVGRRACLADRRHAA